VNDDLASLYDYTRWANSRVIHALEGLTPEQYTQELGGGWSSLRATFVHLAGATWAWNERFRGRDATTLPKEADLPALADAVEVLGKADSELKGFLESLAPEQLARAFTWKNLAGQERTTLFWTVLRHVVNHGTYHRGQIASMVKRVGGKPLSTDMVVWGIERYEGR
jgi:uncharacterized damage-inducible protein DinB